MSYLAHSDYDDHAEFSADVVVVGTGAGGAVVGAELASAGHNVLFVEEGSHHPTTSFNPYVTQSIPRLYRDVSATVIYGRPPIPFVEGRCVGGSTTINGGMTWRTPGEILDEWERLTGQPDIGQKAMESLFEEVEEGISAKFQSKQSIGDDNRIMELGAKKLGWEYKPNKRNQSQCVGANNCILGCPTGAKQSTLVSYMPKALKAGAQCLTEVRIEKLLKKNGRCVGVVGRWNSPKKVDRD